MTLVATVLATLTADGITAHDGRPTVPPPSDYVIVEDRTITTGQRRLACARCRALSARCLGLRDATHPYADPAPGMLRRVDTGPILTDGPSAEIRHSITTTLRCAVPRGAAQAP